LYRCIKASLEIFIAPESAIVEIASELKQISKLGLLQFLCGGIMRIKNAGRLVKGSFTRH